MNTTWRDDFQVCKKNQAAAESSYWLCVHLSVLKKKQRNAGPGKCVQHGLSVSQRKRELEVKYEAVMMCSFVVSSCSVVLVNPCWLLLLVSAGTCLYISDSTRTMQMFCRHNQTFINGCLRWFKNWVRPALSEKSTEAVFSFISQWVTCFWQADRCQSKVNTRGSTQTLPTLLCIIHNSSTALQLLVLISELNQQISYTMSTKAEHYRLQKYSRVTAIHHIGLYTGGVFNTLCK